MNMKDVSRVNRVSRDICDVCGHFWSNPKSKKDSCCICGVGSRIKMNSELDVRSGLRKGVSKCKTDGTDL